MKKENKMKILLAFIALFVVVSACSSCSSSNSMQESFNELASEPEWQPEKIMKVLDIRKGMCIGDLGAGGGYYTYKFSEETGVEGKVYAADINEEYLLGIRKTAKEKGYENITTVLSTENDSKFEDNSLDLIFIRNTFHHFEDKGSYLKNLKSKLKIDGRIVIIDYKEDASFWLFGHDVSRDEILEAVHFAGLQTVNEYDFLEKQYFFVLKKG
jgi:arsenite methyltransferase